MTNRELAGLFDELADIMEISGENHFKIRAYRNASGTIFKSHDKLGEMQPDNLQEMAGIGKAIAEKIEVANKTGTFPTLEKWRSSGFASLRPMLKFPGLSIRKLRAMMKALDVSSINDLRNAVIDGRLDAYEKLDSKTREEIKEEIKWIVKT
jgi:DNA polymerase (family 10)